MEAGKVAVRLGGLVVTLLGEVEWVRVQYHPHFGLAVVGLRHELGIQQHATVPNEIVASPKIKVSIFQVQYVFKTNHPTFLSEFP